MLEQTYMKYHNDKKDHCDDWLLTSEMVHGMSSIMRRLTVMEILTYNRRHRSRRNNSSVTASAASIKVDTGTVQSVSLEEYAVSLMVHQRHRLYRFLFTHVETLHFVLVAA